MNRPLVGVVCYRAADSCKKKEVSPTLINMVCGSSDNYNFPDRRISLKLSSIIAMHQSLCISYERKWPCRVMA